MRLPYATFYELDGDGTTELRGYLAMSALVGRLQDPAAAGVS